jgi:DNA-binding transcriptional LysR family regulator
LDFTSLKYFFETAQCGSIRRASNRLYVTPSAVSRQIAKLEHDLGCYLFERRASGMRLTAAGALLAEQLQTTLRDLDRVRSFIGDLQGLRRGEVVLHCIEGVVDSWLPARIAEFSANYPKIIFRIVVSSTDRITEAIVSGNADIGITFKAKGRSGVKFVSTYHAPLMALMAPTHPLAQRRKLTLSELLEYPITLPDESFGVRRMLDQILSEEKMTVKHLITANSITMVRSLARNGVACTLLPRLSAARDYAAGELVAVPMAAPKRLTASLEICVQEGRILSFAAQEFLKLLVATFHNVN